MRASPSLKGSGHVSWLMTDFCYELIDSVVHVQIDCRVNILKSHNVSIRILTPQNLFYLDVNRGSEEFHQRYYHNMGKSVSYGRILKSKVMAANLSINDPASGSNQLFDFSES